MELGLRETKESDWFGFLGGKHTVMSSYWRVSSSHNRWNGGRGRGGDNVGMVSGGLAGGGGGGGLEASGSSWRDRGVGRGH